MLSPGDPLQDRPNVLFHLVISRQFPGMRDAFSEQEDERARPVRSFERRKKKIFVAPVRFPQEALHPGTIDGTLHSSGDRKPHGTAGSWPAGGGGELPDKTPDGRRVDALALVEDRGERLLAAKDLRFPKGLPHTRRIAPVNVTSSRRSPSISSAPSRGAGQELFCHPSTSSARGSRACSCASDCSAGMSVSCKNSNM
jgi:hypothetical protein